MEMINKWANSLESFLQTICADVRSFASCSSIETRRRGKPQNVPSKYSKNVNDHNQTTRPEIVEAIAPFLTSLVVIVILKLMAIN